jgi:hypothetical protein
MKTANGIGHASATTTLDTYAHLWPESEEITQNAFAAGLSQVVSRPCHSPTPEADAPTLSRSNAAETA